MSDRHTESTGTGRFHMEKYQHIDHAKDSISLIA